MRIRVILKNTKAFTVKVGRRKPFYEVLSNDNSWFNEVFFPSYWHFRECKEERALEATKGYLQVEKEVTCDLPPAELVESLHGATDVVGFFQHSPLCERAEGGGDSPNTRTTSRSPGRRFWDTGPCLEDAANSEVRAPARQQNGHSTGSAAFKRASSWARLSALIRSPSEDGGGLSWYITPRMWAAVGGCVVQNKGLLCSGST